ncbi:MAG TPA: Uma2 family endonuclease [Solirubrobacteraceae bacterium]|nr:Uma2 family endonuclease [Solirubrobacteraceae bacterium]
MSGRTEGKTGPSGETARRTDPARVSPDDQTWEKLDSYAAHHVDELLIVDPEERRVHWLGLTGEGYQPRERSGLNELGPDELARRIDWPA